MQLKDDGSLDIDALTMDEDPEDIAAFIKDIVDCRNEGRIRTIL